MSLSSLPENDESKSLSIPNTMTKEKPHPTGYMVGIAIGRGLTVPAKASNSTLTSNSRCISQFAFFLDASVNGISP